MGVGSCESTASSHRAHLQRSPGPSTYADEPNSQDHKLGRIDRLARPMVQAASDRRSAPAAALRPPLVVSAGAAPWHSGRSRLKGSVLPCPGGQGGDGGDLGRIQVLQRMPWGRRVRRQPMTSSPGRSGRGESRGRSPAASASSCGWTVVATTVSVPSRPASTSNANSRSRSHLPYPPGGPRGSRPRCRRPPGPRVAARPTPIRRPTCAEPVIEAARRGGTSSRAGSRRMKGRSSVRRGTAMYSSLPSARACARTGSWGRRGWP